MNLPWSIDVVLDRRIICVKDIELSGHTNLGGTAGAGYSRPMAFFCYGIFCLSPHSMITKGSFE